MTFKPAQEAFKAALQSGRLALTKPFAPLPQNAVIHYMYMGTDSTGRDSFKHRITREYLP